jgi:SAM-dependent methyltransferase
MHRVATFEELVAEAESADVTGWGFRWLDGRATEERPPWGYARLLATRLAAAEASLDIDTGGGEVLAEALGNAATRPTTMRATEAWPPNVARARAVLAPYDVTVVDTGELGAEDGSGGPAGFPFGDQSFDLVTSRHPVRPWWSEIHRVLRVGGHYFAQHVGPGSAFELIEFFLGPLPANRLARDPGREMAGAEQSGLTVTDLRTARCRMEFFDIGAVVWILRKCVWWVPDFTVPRYLDELHALDAVIRRDGSFVAHSTRHLIEAVRR